MDDKVLQEAWDYFSQGRVQECRSLLGDLDLAGCEDFSLLNLWGYLYLEEQAYDRASQVFECYISLAEEQADKEQEHIGLHQLAMVYREKKAYQPALALIEQERELIDQYFPSDELKLAVNDYERAYLQLKLGNPTVALLLMEQSLAHAHQTDDVIAQACAYRGLGEIYQVLAENKQAQEYFAQAIQLFRQAGDELGADEVRAMVKVD